MAEPYLVLRTSYVNFTVVMGFRSRHLGIWASHYAAFVEMNRKSRETYFT